MQKGWQRARGIVMSVTSFEVMACVPVYGKRQKRGSNAWV